MSCRLSDGGQVKYSLSLSHLLARGHVTKLWPVRQLTRLQLYAGHSFVTCPRATRCDYNLDYLTCPPSDRRQDINRLDLVFGKRPHCPVRRPHPTYHPERQLDLFTFLHSHTTNSPFVTMGCTQDCTSPVGSLPGGGSNTELGHTSANPTQHPKW